MLYSLLKQIHVMKINLYIKYDRRLEMKRSALFFKIHYLKNHCKYFNFKCLIQENFSLKILS